MGDKLISYVRPQLLDKKKMQVFSHELPNVPKPRTARTRNPRGRQGAGPFHDKTHTPPPPPQTSAQPQPTEECVPTATRNRPTHGKYQEGYKTPLADEVLMQ